MTNDNRDSEMGHAMRSIALIYLDEEMKNILNLKKFALQ